jgi:hypothetical protein
VPLIPVFNDELATSVRSIIVFPNDLAKAEAYASWMLLRGTSHLNRSSPVKEFLKEGYQIDPLAVADLSQRAAEHAESYKDAIRASHDGTVVGEIIKTLWALICTDPHTASMNIAMPTVENYAAANGLKTGVSTMHAYLGEFRKVLHLLGAWSIRGRRFTTDTAVGYDGINDLYSFLAESEKLLRELKNWATTSGSHHQHLSGDDFYRVPSDWWPPERQTGWPKTGGIPDIKVHAGIVPAHRKRGRPRRNPI